MDIEEVKQWKYMLESGIITNAQTFFQGFEVVFIGYLWKNPYFDLPELGLIINETFRSRPKILWKAVKEGLEEFIKTESTPFIATADDSLPGRARFLHRLGLEYKQTIPDYWGEGRDAEVYQCPSSFLF